ncbi:asparaginase domain-containing protein [Mariniflexile sp.]|uniref:asparaginase domain-containing protein n=1 Tax=Mariniflexile sp. TaxID=1979402 RepID=UPI00356272DB
MKLVFIQTGGTIDKDYPNKTKGWAFEFGEPATNRILENLNPSFEFEVITACQKDSLEITDKDRQHLVELINSQNTNKFIITHGTDTMIETAIYLGSCMKDKLIIITGAMRPERFSNSDAAINLGCSIAAANLLEKGVFVTMNGIVKEHTAIGRNIETGKFY